MPNSLLRAIIFLGCATAGGFTLAACDSALPSDPEPTLVVEGFIDTGKPPPAIRLSRTLSLKSRYDSTEAAVVDAGMSVTIGSRVFDYAPDHEVPGLFRPVGNTDAIAEAGESFSLDVDWNGTRASTDGRVPPQIHLLSVHVDVPDSPVSAVLLDSLLLSDSLAIGAYEGFIYPIEVSLTWDVASDQIPETWIRAQLRPYSDFSSPVVDLFLRSEAIFREEDVSAAEAGTRTWTGVYAIGVPASDAPVPEHSLRIAIIRSGRDYARFASSIDAPERREPLSNLRGAIGIFTAISVDSTRVYVGAAR